MPLTGMYDVLEKLRTELPLTDNERDVREKGQATILRKIHDSLDRGVADAYGWPADLPKADVLARLAALNQTRRRSGAASCAGRAPPTRIPKASPARP